MKTLNIRLLPENVVTQSIILLVIICVISEVIARTPIVKSMNLYESYGGSHPQFDTQVVRIKSRYTKEGHIDCILLGNSQILSGIDPAVLQQIYQKKTGRNITCQTFGLGGLVPSTAASLAKLLIQKYHPSIIIFGTSMFDYTFYNSADASIMSSPWVKYQLGTFSIDGWLIENSNAYRYYLGINHYLLYYGANGETRLDSNGHLPFYGRDEKTKEQLLNETSGILKTLDITETQVNGLYNIVSLNSDDVKIIVLEMPVNPEIFGFSRYARKIYPDFRNILINETTLAGAELLLTKDKVEIPENDWHDLTHLNQTGTLYFSHIVGNYMTNVVLSKCERKTITFSLCEDNSNE